jgi:CDP-2,3-bis-(O-geranylgeranyl)-sn-glycerol synthase
MHLLAIVQVMALLTVANGAPVIAKRILGDRLAWPLDAGRMFFDQRPLFGSSKTVRGLLVALLFTTAAAPLVGLHPKIGAIIAVTAMAGDLLSSFIKRRLGLRPSSQALGVDQIPESLLPMLACRNVLSFTIADIVLAVGIFLVTELILSRLLYKAHLRDTPY